MEKIAKTGSADLAKRTVKGYEWLTSYTNKK
jgi:hypothetical protein